MLDITVKGSEDLRKMARALRKADREDLRKELGKAMREASKPTLEAVRKSAREIHTTGFPHPPSRFLNLETTALTKRQSRAEQVHHEKTGLTGLVHRFTATFPDKGTREKIAKAVVVDVRVEEASPRVRIRVSEAKLPDNLKGMPRKFDSGKKWRHPVMGNREVWVDQIADPWFWPPIKDNIKTFRAEIDRALDRVREMLERA